MHSPFSIGLLLSLGYNIASQSWLYRLMISGLVASVVEILDRNP